MTEDTLDTSRLGAIRSRLGDNLPSDWSLTTLGEAFKWGSGGTPKRTEPRFYDGDIPWLIIGDLNDGVVTDSETMITQEGLNASSAKWVEPGSVLLAMYGSIGKLGISGARLTTNQAIAFTKPDPVDPKYLFYYLMYTRDDLASLGKGATQKNISQTVIKAFPFVLAPQGQQQRIVAQIEKQFSRLDEAVANLKRVKANLKRYKAAVLKAAVEGKLTEAWRGGHPGIEPASALIERVEQPPRPNRYKTRSKDRIPGHSALAVGNPGTPLPAGWAWVHLVDIARMESGHTPSRRHPEWWDGDVAWIGIADAREHDGKVIRDTQQHTNTDGLANSAARLLPAGTVCVSRTASVGYVVVMGKDMATSQDFVNWVPTEAVSSDWLRIVFSADREALRRFGKGSVHKTIYFPEWLSVHIALPPREEQDTIVADIERRLTSLEQVGSTLVANGIRAERLRQSILGFAFKGL